MSCDLLIPTLDEAETLPALFAALEPLRRDTIDRVVVCDNGSTDRTPEIAAEHGATVVREPRRGYGAACLCGLEWLAAQSREPSIVAFLDADLSDDPAWLPALLEPIDAGEADIVIGSRVRLAERGALNVVQRFGNALACSLIQLASGRPATDLGPFRAVRWSTFQSLGMADRTWGWTVELQAKAAMRGIPVMEIDVPYRRRHAGRSKISGTVRGVSKAGTKILWTIGSVWIEERSRR